jgi:hypothetical protein
VDVLEHAESDDPRLKALSNTKAAYIHSLAMAEERGLIDRAEAERRYANYLTNGA